jgi:cobalt/nickel transport system permease protein
MAKHVNKSKAQDIKGDAFVDKTIMALLRILALMRAQDGGGASWISRLPINDFYKLCCTLTLIVFSALTRSGFFLLTVLTCELLALAFMPLPSLKRILAAGGAAFLFSGLLVVPAIVAGRAGNAAMIPWKAFVSASAAGMLAQTSKFSGITGALKRLFIPDFLILALDLGLKSVVALGELSLEMMRALKMRRIGGRGGGARSLAGVGGTIFLKSKEMAEEMHSAMVCRGFSGAYRPVGRLTMNRADIVYLTVNLGIAALFFWLRIHG